MKRKFMPVLVVCLLIFLVLIGFLVQKYMPTKEKMKAEDYYGQMAEGEAAVILGTEIMEQRGIISGEFAYLPLNIVNRYLNQRYYWDAENQQIIYATPSAVYTEPSTSEIGGNVLLKNDVVYLKIDYVKQYTDLDVMVATNPGRIAVQYRFQNIPVTYAKKNTYVRYLGGIKSKVLTKVAKGTELIVMEELENWTQVATYDGYIGYVEKKKLSPVTEKSSERVFQKEEYQHRTIGQTVNLVWHQVTNQDANDTLLTSIENMTGVNVISPTWFAILDNSGNISSIASETYVAQAHERGLQVWGLVDNFGPDFTSLQVLSSTSARTNLIQQLISEALRVGLDGINIDFENLEEDAGVHFLQFLREISVECNKYNLILSVDNPVPEAHTDHYNRREQGRVVDYVIIMGYDEHYVGSEAGSVASLPWVEEGIINTLKDVPAERVINAVPFYTRLWTTQAGTLTSSAIGMAAAQESITASGAEPYWNNEVSQNYAEWESEGITYQIWQENAQSIAEKVKLVPKYNLAGVAAWKLGFENSEIWQTISDNLNN